ncbi:hypothetical protein G7067_05205 [Leucobacter insecticola]|uniref:Uncharacterized protein n=1 Tax=Leucobacter insecticola TaxID=2714934 RepID=A0A6G8FHX4_9MICO|nr:hypothetical protein [Leucobacter insecticola]QIM15951.1 hypothetical protein G7067_05205 [Leucobacter insecticola]
MAGAIYRVIDLSQEVQEGEEATGSELLTEIELFDRFVGKKVDRSKPSNNKTLREWIEAFTSIEALQLVESVRLEKLDSKQVFEDECETFEAAKEKLKKTRSALKNALLSVLSDVTPEDIAAGAVYDQKNKKLGVVEFYTSKLTPTPVKDLIEKHSDDLPAHVLDELRLIQDRNRLETAAKFKKK